MTRYLRLVHACWSEICGSSADSLDRETVSLLEGMAPSFSSHDEMVLKEYWSDGALFRSIGQVCERDRIWGAIMSLRCRIPSLRTFLEDTKYLEPCSKALRSLLPAKFKGSIEDAMARQYNGDCPVMESEDRDFPYDRSKANQRFRVAYLQTWLCAFRNFTDLTDIQPRKDAGRSKPLPRGQSPLVCHWFAKLARSSGFDSTPIRKAISQDPRRQMCEDFLRRSSPFVYQDRPLDVVHRDVDKLLRHVDITVPSKGNGNSNPSISSSVTTTISNEHRCGKPFEAAYYANRGNLHLTWIYNPCWLSFDRFDNITIFGIQREVFLAFFGHHSCVTAWPDECSELLLQDIKISPDDGRGEYSDYDDSSGDEESSDQGESNSYEESNGLHRPNGYGEDDTHMHGSNNGITLQKTIIPDHHTITPPAPENSAETEVNVQSNAIIQPESNALITTQNSAADINVSAITPHVPEVQMYTMQITATSHLNNVENSSVDALMQDAGIVESSSRDNTLLGDAQPENAVLDLGILITSKGLENSRWASVSKPTPTHWRKGPFSISIRSAPVLIKTFRKYGFDWYDAHQQRVPNMILALVHSDDQYFSCLLAYELVHNDWEKYATYFFYVFQPSADESIQGGFKSLTLHDLLYDTNLQGKVILVEPTSHDVEHVAQAVEDEQMAKELFTDKTEDQLLEPLDAPE